MLTFDQGQKSNPNRSQDSAAPDKPPGFGITRPSRSIRFEWWEGHPPSPTRFDKHIVILKTGMEVPADQWEDYWQALQGCRKSYELRLPGHGEGYYLVDADTKIMGFGEFHPDHTPEDMAWIHCMFLRLRNWRTAYVTSEPR